MNSAHSLVNQLINPKSVMSKVKEILREVDPDYEKEERAFIAACATFEAGLGGSVSFTAQDYLDALEESFASDIVFVVGRGFKLNLDIYHNPVNALAFKLDYEDLHQERMMPLVPAAKKANKASYDYLEELRASHRDKLDLLDGVNSFYSYLQTVGYKVAHYYGYLLADQLLPHLVPGYYADSAYVSTYGLILNKDIGVNVFNLK